MPTDPNAIANSLALGPTTLPSVPPLTAAPPTLTGVPVSPAGVGPPATPPSVAAGQPPSSPPPPPPAQVSPDGTLQSRQPADKITNPFERQATMIVDTAQDWATRLASNLGDHPSDQTPTSSETVHEMFHFSRYGMDAAAQFWRVHDEMLQLATQNGDPDPYAVAERHALDTVYPYRSKIALLDTLGPDEKVARAEQLASMSHREIAKGNTHDSLPTIVGPRGLPQPPTQTQPQQNGTGGSY